MAESSKKPVSDLSEQVEPESGQERLESDGKTVEKTVPREQKHPDELPFEEGGPPPPAPPASGSGQPPGEEPPEEEEEELGGKMTFLEHLDDLRKRLLYSFLAIGIAFAGSWFFIDEIFYYISLPIQSAVQQLTVTRPAEPFTIKMKVAFVTGIFVSIPVILLQLWMFIAPGLYRRERSYVIPFLLSSTVLFIAGGLFAYFIILPPALNFLLNVMGANFNLMITAMEYFDFVLVIILGAGAAFQLPVLVAFLSLFGLISPGFLWKNFRYAFILILIAAAVISPTPDPFNLFLWAAPIVGLYVISIGISWIFNKRRNKRLRDLGVID